LNSVAEALKGRSGVGGITMLKSFWMIVEKIGGILTPILLGGIFFFAIIGVFGIWIAVAGLLTAVMFALITVSFAPAEGDAR
jgi:hypothetical protein